MVAESGRPAGPKKQLRIRECWLCYAEMSTPKEQKQLESAIYYIRNKADLEVFDAVAHGKRVQWFEGSKFVELLKSDKFQKHTGLSCRNNEEATSLSNKFMNAGYFHRSERVISDVKKEYLELTPSGKQHFDLDGAYTWVYAPSQLRVYLLATSVVVGIIAICMIKVWPLWLKIAVWWVSVIYLTTTTSIVAVRLVLFSLCWLVGFRGVWLFPNMFTEDESIGFLESFTPFIAQDKKRPRNKQSDEKEEAGKDTASIAQTEELQWKFGVLNFVFLMVIGVLICRQLGVFDTENIPEFVTTQRALWEEFPSLAPPDVDLSAEEPAAEGGEPS